MLMVAIFMVSVMIVMTAPAFAKITEGPGKGNPDTTASGKCPPGQNKDTSPGGLKKITPVNTSCENRGGQEPGGQQPTCQGEGLKQNKENQNPAGHAPPGQNP